MASANLELVRSIYAKWERGEYGSVDWADPEIEYVFADGPEPGSWTGLAGMAKANRYWPRAWEDIRLEVDECRQLDDERVLVLMLMRGRGKASGLHLQMHGACLFRLRDGKVTRLVVYWDRDRLFADLGLSSERGSLSTGSPQS